MTKRTRGPARTHRRPGARPPSERGAARRRATVVAPPSQLVAAEEAAELVMEDRPAEAAATIGQTAQARPSRHRVKAGSLLAARATTEYVYVAKDMRRILVVAALLIAVMLVLWVLLVVMRVVPLPFY